MQSQEIICTKDGKEIGRKIFDLPETVAEALDMFGEEDVITNYIKSKVRELRNSLRPNKESEAITAVYHKLLNAGVEESIAAQASGYDTLVNV